MSDPTKPKTPQASTGRRGTESAAGTAADGTKSKGSKETVAEGAAKVARGAQEMASQVASQVADRTREGIEHAGENLRSSAEEQKDAGADRVRNIAHAVGRAADELETEVPQAAQYVRRAARELENVSEAVRRRDLTELVGTVQDFARRQPTAFLAASVLAGCAGVRFLKTSSQARASSPVGGERQEGPSSSRPANDPSMGRQSDQVKGTQTTSGLATEDGTAGQPANPPSGDPGGVSPEAPGFATKPAGPESGRS